MHALRTSFRQKLSIFGLLLILFCASCSSVKLIADYDEVSYTTINTIQQDITTFFVDMDANIGTPKAKYAAHTNFYRDLKIKTEVLKLRANAIDKNEIVIKQVELLQTIISTLENLDKSGINSKAELIPIRNGFNSAMTAMLKLQIALKRGKG
ncbi:hypothetical protein [Pedobacter aquatilis]|uniref:hypothetical protein n=1 Tax=Pedobacter aquatilis TaxID=351343 RepID=UPI0029319A30|nr:hypothetical protein [Pedobacter aquatilis]